MKKILGYEIAHIGINCQDDVIAKEVCTNFVSGLILNQGKEIHQFSLLIN